MAVRRLALLLPLILILACSSDETPTVVQPAGPTPAPVTDLEVTTGAAGSLTLSWTSPALPDDLTGAISYELRHCAPGDEDGPYGAWAAVAAPASDDESGISRGHQVTGLTSGATYLFRLRSRVGSGTWSSVSNTVIATAATDHDQTPPASVAELRQWAGMATSVTVAFTAAGDDSIYGAATNYEVRWHETATRWASMTPAAGEVTPTAKDGWLQSTIEGIPEDAEIGVRVQALDEAGHRSMVSELFYLTADTMRVWYVKVDGTGDTPTLEAAVQAAGPGDLVLVGPGRYTWTNQGTGDLQYGLVHVPLQHVGFTIRGEEGAENTILDSERIGPVMVITGAILGPGEDVPLWPGITVEGLTMTRGLAIAEEATPGTAYAGAGLTMHVSNSIIRNCIITDNESTIGGGFWYGGQGQPIIENCQITNNVASRYGGGIFIANTPYPVRVRNTVISGNESRYGGGVYVWHALVDFDYVLITRNHATVQGGGTGFDELYEGCSLTHCTIAGNKGGLGTAMRLSTQSFLTVENCILFGNTGGRAISAQSGSTVAAGCSVVYGHTVSDDWPRGFDDLGGNFNQDPRFCNFNSYTLRSGSPCLPGNHPTGGDCGTIGARSEGCSR